MLFLRIGRGRWAAFLGASGLVLLAACTATTTTTGGALDPDGGTTLGTLPTDDGGTAKDATTKTDAGTDAAKPACDPEDKDCVACGDKSCSAPEMCCYSDGGASCGSCAAAPSRSACDGREDCPGEKCCVQMSASATKATGASKCASSCTMSNGSTGSGSSVSSVACHTKSDCAGVAGQFGVPYSECCRVKGYDVGVCLSQTFAGAFEDYGGTCD